MNILFIGNSYTYYNDMPLLFEKLCVENGRDVKVNAVTCGGHKLYEYLDNGDQYVEELNALAKNQKYDICFLQEHSTFSALKTDIFVDAVYRLTEKLKNCAKQFILYETWGRKAGSDVLEKNQWTNESMTFKVAEAYKKASEKVSVPISHVGRYFYGITNNHKEINLYHEDLSHPSYEGSCLAALTHYVTVFKTFPKNTDSLGLNQSVLDVYKDVIMREAAEE